MCDKLTTTLEYAMATLEGLITNTYSHEAGSLLTCRGGIVENTPGF